MADASAADAPAGAAVAPAGNTLSSTLIRRDEYLLQHRAELVASPAAVAAFLAAVKGPEGLGLDLEELRVGWSSDADERDCGTATRFLFLAMKHLMEEGAKPADPREAEDAMVARAVKLVREALEYRRAHDVTTYCAAAAAVWEELKGEGGGSSRSGDGGDGGAGSAAGGVPGDPSLVTARHREQTRLILRGIYQPCGTTDAGIPMILLRPGDFIMELGASFVAPEPPAGDAVTAAGSSVGGYISSFFFEAPVEDAGGAAAETAAASSASSSSAEEAPAALETFPDVEFTPALIGVTDSVFKVACGAQSVRAGSVVDRMTILVDCGNLDLWKIAEVKRLCTAFFGILKEVSPETLETVYMVNVPSLVIGPVNILMRLFTDEDSYRRLKFLDAPSELAPFIGEANIPPALLAGR